MLEYIDNEGLQSLCPPVCLYYEMNALLEDIDRDAESGNSDAHRWIAAEMRRISDERSRQELSQPHVEFF